MRKEIEEVKTGLAELHRKGIIHYEPKKETPHIRFLQNRVKAEDLYIDAVAYLKRKAAFEKRVKAMMAYMLDTGCRAQYIGRYFGDEQIVACGICDHCLANKKTALSSEEYRLIAATLQKILSEQSYSPMELVAMIPGIGKEKIWKVLDDWSAEEKIRITAEGKVMLK